MLFWNNKALIVNKEFQNDPAVVEISHKRTMRKRVFYKATSTCIIAPPFHPGFYVSTNSVPYIRAEAKQHHKLDTAWTSHWFLAQRYAKQALQAMFVEPEEPENPLEIDDEHVTAQDRDA
eukprot:1252734-Prorocentrum_lima.AAC.1